MFRIMGAEHPLMMFKRQVAYLSFSSGKIILVTVNTDTVSKPALFMDLLQKKIKRNFKNKI
jgi:hypothetical protein